MDNQFFKILGTLFGIGAAVAFAKGIKSKKNWREIVSEMIVTGALAISAGLIFIVWPGVNPLAVMAGGALLAVLGVAFVSEKIERGLALAADKYLKKKEPNGE